MIVYHGSYAEIINPDIIHSRKSLDFGPGFYVTPLYGQAKKWSEKFKRRGKNAIISKYFFDEIAFEKMNTIIFNSYSEEWLDFIVTCRSEMDMSEYDIVVGGVANDKVFNTIELFFDGLIDKKMAISKLKYEKPNLQICLRSQDAIDRYLMYEGSEQV